MKKCFIAIWLMVLVMGVSFGSFAEGIVTIDVTPGYGGVVVAGEVVPIDLDITAIDRDIVGKVKVSYQFEDQNAIVASELPIQLSKGSSKAYRLPLMMEQNFYMFNKEEFLTIEIFNERGQLLYQGVTGITEIIGEGDLTVGALSERYVGLTYFNLARLKTTTDSNIVANTLKMKSDYLEEARYIDGIDVLVVDGLEKPLSKSGQSTLEQWIEDGGVLVLSTGDVYSSQASLIESLGIQVNPALTVSPKSDFEGLKEINLVDQTFEETRFPSVYTKEYGTGKIIFTAYSLSSKQIVESGNNVRLIEEILQEEILGNGYGRTLDHDNFRSLRYTLNRVPKESMPSIKLIVTIVAIYILLIGPVGYFVLKKRGQTTIYWRLVSGMAVLTTIVVFVAGQGINFNKTVANGLTIIDQRIGNNKTTTFLGVKSSGFGDVDIAPQDGNIKWSGIYEYGETPKERLFYYDTNQHVVFKDVKKFQFVNLMVEHALDMPDVPQELVLNQNGGDVIITNPFDVGLKDVAVIINDNVEYIGAIPAKDFVKINLENGFFEQYGMRWNSYNFYDQLPATVEDVSTKNRVVETFFDNLDKGRFNSETNLLVFGWLENETRQTLLVNDEETSVIGKNFWVDTIQLGTPENGSGTLPYGTVVPDVVTTGETYYDSYDRYFWGYGEAVFTFNMPEWMFVEEGRLMVDNRTGMVYKLYNNETQAWDQLTFDDGSAEIILSASHISEEGKLQLMALNNSGDSFYKPMVTISGVVNND